MKENYLKLLYSGMFWEFHPELTGDWKQDKNAWMIIESNRAGIKPANTIELQITASKINFNGDVISRDYITAKTSDTHPRYTTVDHPGDVNLTESMPADELIMILETVLHSLKGGSLNNEL